MTTDDELGTNELTTDEELPAVDGLSTDEDWEIDLEESSKISFWAPATSKS